MATSGFLATPTLLPQSLRLPMDSDHPVLASRNARSGLMLFAVYVLLYGGFIFLAVFRPDVMASPAVAGVNVAIVYGMVLIGAALMLALIYMVLCRGSAEEAA